MLRERASFDVVGLLTTFDEARERVPMHAVRAELIRSQAAAANLELWAVPIPYPCPNAEYEAAMSRVMQRARAAGIGHVAFGDLHLAEVRAYREDKLRGAGITPLFPLWGMPPRALVDEMLDAGLRARVTCVDLGKLPRRFVGRELDRAFLAELPPEVDVCGENGEFHTFVYDGPMFRAPIPIVAGDVVEQGGWAYADVLPG